MPQRGGNVQAVRKGQQTKKAVAPLSSWGVVDFFEMCYIRGADSDHLQDIFAHLNIQSLEELRDRIDVSEELKPFNLRYVVRHNLLAGIAVLRDRYPPVKKASDQSRLSVSSNMSSYSTASAAHNQNSRNSMVSSNSMVSTASNFSNVPVENGKPIMDARSRHHLADLAADNEFEEVLAFVEADRRVVNLCRPGGKGKWTLLHQAASYGNKEAILALLSFGADPRLKNSTNQTAADVAEEFEQDVCEEILRRAEDDFNRPKDY